MSDNPLRPSPISLVIANNGAPPPGALTVQPIGEAGSIPNGSGIAASGLNTESLVENVSHTVAGAVSGMPYFDGRTEGSATPGLPGLAAQVRLMKACQAKQLKLS